MGRKIGSFGLVNYRRHPKDPNYIVFGFNTPEEAAIFEKELVKTKTWFEKDLDETETGTVHLFAVAESSLDDAIKANGRVRAFTHEPLFKNIFLRYALIIFLLLIVLIGVIGYVKNPSKVTNPDLPETTDTTNLER